MIIIILLVLFGMAYYLFNLGLNPKQDKSKVFKDTSAHKEKTTAQIQAEEWFDKNHNDIYLNSSKDNLRLHAYEFENANSDVWVIVVHGYMIDGRGMCYVTEEFFKRGYHVLVPDLRGHGKSEGKYIGMGIPDRFDLSDWIQYLLRNHPERKIILYGISMGASTVMMATGENMPQQVKLAISDCGYSSVWKEFSYQLKRLFKLPSFPILNLASLICKIRAGYFLNEYSSTKALVKSNTPTLFIHGTEDDFVPFYMLQKNYDAAKCPKGKLAVKGARHSESFTIENTLYWNTIDAFICKYL